MRSLSSVFLTVVLVVGAACKASINASSSSSTAADPTAAPGAAPPVTPAAPAPVEPALVEARTRLVSVLHTVVVQRCRAAGATQHEGDRQTCATAEARLAAPAAQEVR